MFAMGLRTGLIIGMVLFLTIMATFLVMYLDGDILMERISLGALIIALCMLTDNAIIIIEGIKVGIEAGREKMEVVREAVTNNQWSLFGATAIAVIAFAAIGLSNDSTGEYCNSLFWVIFISLTLSWISAITITPLLSSMFFSPKPIVEGVSNDPYGGPIFSAYRRLLALSLRWRRTVMVLSIVAFIAALYGFGYVSQSFFPPATRPQFMVDVFLPAGTHIRNTESTAASIEEFIQRQKGVSNVTTFVGGGGLRFMLVYSPERENRAFVQFLVDVKNADNINQLIVDIQRELDERFPNANAVAKKFLLGPGAGGRIQARFQGPDPAVLRQLADRAVRVIEDDGNAIGVRHDWREREKVLRPDLFELQARRNGITRVEVSQALETGFEAETGPLATSWHSNKFLNPSTDGVVLPILHLNGYKIANPTVLARISHDELDHLFRGYGYTPHFVEGSDPWEMHQRMAATLDSIMSDIQRIKDAARRDGAKERPRWPMIVLRTPKGWTCPPQIDGKRTEDYWRSHQVPMGDMDKVAHIKILERWMKSYKPYELFDKTGAFQPELAELAPRGHRRMSANPHANGGLLLKDLRLPDFREYAVKVPGPGVVEAESTRVMGAFLRDTMKLNLGSRNFRLFSPDENNSNRWQDVLEVTNRTWMADRLPYDDHLAPDGRVMEMLSEHQCQGWLEGYLLTGRHGFFSCYEAFIHIIDSMFNQHAKWLKVCGHIPWRRPIASLNYLLSSHVWRQDHNGFSHQDPGFIDHVVNKKAEVIRVYLPPDANTLLSVTDHCLRSRNHVNVIVAGKQSAPQWLDMDAAVKHCTAGIGIWKWASNDRAQ